ncbi:hypothetical protein C8Q73DRAFT_675779 [Cubamyces lactineus]|nr:hypothetical protein C8Q73DRAFT_675779 [Cubamyces lactineus]
MNKHIHDKLEELVEALESANDSSQGSERGSELDGDGSRGSDDTWEPDATDEQGADEETSTDDDDNVIKRSQQTHRAATKETQDLLKNSLVALLLGMSSRCRSGSKGRKGHRGLNNRAGPY